MIAAINNIIIGITLIIIFLLATWLLLLTNAVASAVKSLEKQNDDLRSQITAINGIIENSKGFITSGDVQRGFKQAYDEGLISKEIYKKIL